MDDLSIRIQFANATFLRSIGCRSLDWYYKLFDKYNLNLDPLVYFFLHWQFSISKINNYRDFCSIFGMKCGTEFIPGDGHKILEYFYSYLAEQKVCLRRIKLCFKIAETIYYS